MNTTPASEVNTTNSKILALCILLVETFICGTLPLCFINCLRRAGTRSVNRILELANLFAGGVFLATLLLHLMPEASEILSAALEEEHLHISYPLPELIVAAGFFLIAITEQLAFCFHHPSHEHPSPHVHSNHNGYDDNKHVHENTYLLSREKPPNYSQNSTEEKPSRSASIREDTEEKPSRSASLIEDTSCSHDAPVLTHDAHDHIASVMISPPQKSLTIRSLLFFLALSLHSLFEGVAIGLQQSDIDVLETLLAVAIHKGVIAFSFTLSMTQQAIVTPVVMIYVIGLAVISPTGIAIGIVITETGDHTSADLANGVLQCIASGTFLFVVFFEILPRELHCHNKIDGALNLVLTLLGFGLMAGLQAIGGGEHSHSHG